MQVACPRLSIDWGMAFEKPLLSPYEVSEISIPIPERSYVEQLCFKNYLSCIYFCKHVLIMYIHIQTMFICSQMFNWNLHFINHIKFSWKINVFSLHHACVLFFYLMKYQEIFRFPDVSGPECCPVARGLSHGLLRQWQFRSVDS